MAMIPRVPNTGNVFNDFRISAGSTIAGVVRQLLETKHLYQSAEVDFTNLLKLYSATSDQVIAKKLLAHTANVNNWPWIVQGDDNLQTIVNALSKSSLGDMITWQAPDIKTYCKTCGRLEPFNQCFSANFLNRQNPSFGGYTHKNFLIQVYALSYLCQSCKSVPEVFLIRRRANKLTLSGRAPIEHAEVPDYIPKKVNDYYSGAIVAYQSGQTLAALFLLRTVCEQWAREYADASDKADIAIDKYMQTLPDDFKNRFPSLRNIYSDVSAAIHSAKPSEELYKSTLDGISEHFQARQLYKL